MRNILIVFTIIFLFSGCVKKYQVIQDQEEVSWNANHIYFKNNKYPAKTHTSLKISSTKNPKIYEAFLETDYRIWRPMYYKSFFLKTDKGIIEPIKCSGSVFKHEYQDEYMTCLINSDDLKIGNISQAGFILKTSVTKGGLNGFTPLNHYIRTCQSESKYRFGIIKKDFVEKCYKLKIAKVRASKRIIENTYEKYFDKNSEFVRTFNEFQNIIK